MRTTELSSEELLYLKGALYYGADELPEITEDQQKIIDEALCIDEIPDELVHKLFAECEIRR